MDNLNANPLIQRIEASKNLPTLPHILLKIIEVSQREDAQFKQLSRLIEKDPALTSKILSLVNSTHYGLANKIASLEQALPLIGMDAVKNIALCASIHHLFAEGGGPSVFDMKRFWKHSLLTAEIARQVAVRIRYPSPDEAFLGGLLHDLGRLVLWANLTEEYEKVLAAGKAGPEVLLAEEAKLGALHSEVGAWLVQRWNLQFLMADAVLYHHEPLHRIVHSFPLVKVVHCSNLIAGGGNGQIKDACSVASTLFGLKEQEVKEILTAAEGRVGDTARLLEIDIEDEGATEESKSQDRKKRETLGQVVKNISLVLAALQNIGKARSEDDLIRILYQSLEILLGLRRILFFRYDSRRDLLVFRSPNGPAPLAKEGLILSLQEGSSLLVESLQRHGPVSSLADVRALSILDEELRRALKSDGFLCFPIAAFGQNVGVLMIGVDQRDLPHLQKKESILRLVAGQVALALYSEEVKESRSTALLSEKISSSAVTVQKIAHEINNPLAIVKNYLTILDKKLVQDNRKMEEIRVINEEINRVSALLEELSELSHMPARETQTFDLNAMISELMTLHREPLQLSVEIGIRRDLDPALPPMNGPKDRLKQILINLITNAAEAIGSSGNITVGTRYLPNLPPPAFAGLNGVKGVEQDQVELTISDDGPGIPETVRLHLFEPYNSTKGLGRRGLGLSIVYALVQEMKGTISCQSSREKGTCFKIQLPLK